MFQYSGVGQQSRRPLQTAQPCASSAESISSWNRHAVVLDFAFFFEDVPDSAGVYMFDVVLVLFGIEQKGFFFFFFLSLCNCIE